MNAREVTELLISWLTISFAFAWIHVNILAPTGISDFLGVFTIMLVAVGAGFVLHELAHKYVAIHYGAHAEFFMWKAGLLLAVVLAVTLGAVFAAPGAVYIFGGQISARQNGIISVAGPVTNLAIAFLFGLIYSTVNPTGFIEALVLFTMQINFFLAFFNMLPIPPLDGSKVFVWSKGAWLITTLVAFIGSFFFQGVVSLFS